MSAVKQARIVNSHIKDNLSLYKYEDLEGIDLYLSNDHNSGFGVTRVGELVNVFSVIKGRGNELLTFAKMVGANHLDCFDGYLVMFYTSHGFVTYKVESNYILGGPSVIYMRLN